MKKIPFTLDAWLKDKSQKVVHANGSEVIDFASLSIEWVVEEMQANDLFLIPAEPELTEFEKGLEQFIKAIMVGDNHRTVESFVREHSAELLAIARKEIEKDLPRWKHTGSSLRFTLLEGAYGWYILHDGWSIPFNDVFNKLPKSDE